MARNRRRNRRRAMNPRALPTQGRVTVPRNRLRAGTLARDVITVNRPIKIAAMKFASGEVVPLAPWIPIFAWDVKFHYMRIVKADVSVVSFCRADANGKCFVWYSEPTAVKSVPTDKPEDIVSAWANAPRRAPCGECVRISFGNLGNNWVRNSAVIPTSPVGFDRSFGDIGVGITVGEPNSVTSVTGCFAQITLTIEYKDMKADPLNVSYWTERDDSSPTARPLVDEDDLAKTDTNFHQFGVSLPKGPDLSEELTLVKDGPSYQPPVDYGKMFSSTLTCIKTRWDYVGDYSDGKPIMISPDSCTSSDPRFIAVKLTDWNRESVPRLTYSGSTNDDFLVCTVWESNLRVQLKRLVLSGSWVTLLFHDQPVDERCSAFTYDWQSSHVTVYLLTGTTHTYVAQRFVRRGDILSLDFPDHINVPQGVAVYIQFSIGGRGSSQERALMRDLWWYASRNNCDLVFPSFTLEALLLGDE